MLSSKRRRIIVRPASVDDSAAIARVCLLTAYQGRSAESRVKHPELPSQVRALPYLHLPSGFGFVLVETVESEGSEQSESEMEMETKPQNEGSSELGEEEDTTTDSESKTVVGYVVGTGETAQFQREVDASWWPSLRTKYPKDLVGTPLDRYFIGLIHKGTKLTSTGPAHIHVNVLGKYKSHGCDRLLLDVALNHLRKREHSKAKSLNFCHA